jgi:hypothetical protein
MPRENAESEAQIHTSIVSALKQLPVGAHRRDRTRLVANLLFMEHGIYPSARAVLDYTHQGSLTDISKDLRDFWGELRDKLRVNVNAPFLPKPLVDEFAAALMKIWELAISQARTEFDGLRQDAASTIASAHADASEARRQTHEARDSLHGAEVELHKEREMRQAAEKCADAQTAEIKGLQTALEQWQRQAEAQARARKESEARFSQDLAAERAERQRETERFSGEFKFAKLQIETARAAERDVRDQLKMLGASKEVALAGYRQRLSISQEGLSAAKLELAEMHGKSTAMEAQLRAAQERIVALEEMAAGGRIAAEERKVVVARKPVRPSAALPLKVKRRTLR